MGVVHKEDLRTEPSEDLAEGQPSGQATTPSGELGDGVTRPLQPLGQGAASRCGAHYPIAPRKESPHDQTSLLFPTAPPDLRRVE